MKLLAVDTSTEYLTLAIMDGNKVSGRIHKKAAMRHSSLLIPMMDKVLKKTGLKIKDIDGFCIGIGPGSFTGLRIGVATLKALAYSLNKPIVAVPTLDAIAQNARRSKGVICPVLDARKNKVYACLYKSDGNVVKKISKYLLIPAGELVKKIAKYASVLFLGDAVEQIFRVTRGPAFTRAQAGMGWGNTDTRLSYSNCKPHAKRGARKGDRAAGPEKFIMRNWHPRAEVIGRLGLEDFKKRKFVKPEDLEPMYLYSKECDITGS